MLFGFPSDPHLFEKHVRSVVGVVPDPRQGPLLRDEVVQPAGEHALTAGVGGGYSAEEGGLRYAGAPECGADVAAGGVAGVMDCKRVSFHFNQGFGLLSFISMSG